MDPGHGETPAAAVGSSLFCPGLSCSDLRPLCLQVRCQSPSERQQVLDHLESQLADFLSDSRESSLFTAGERRELESEVQQAQQQCRDLLVNMETGETSAAMWEHGPSNADEVPACIHFSLSLQWRRTSQSLACT